MIVSVVATYHATKGLATPEALVRLLESISPEVLFLEVPEAKFLDFRDGHIDTLESQAVRLYCEGSCPVLVPVDAPLPPDNFWRGNEELFGRINRVSLDYRRLHDAHMSALVRGGFAYLNSETGSDAQAAVDEEILASLEYINNKELFGLHETWREINDSRENTMLSGITSYARHNPFGRAAFLVGGAHRRSIMRKTRGGLSSAPPSLQWEFITLPLPDGAA